MASAVLKFYGELIDRILKKASLEKDYDVFRSEDMRLLYVKDNNGNVYPLADIEESTKTLVIYNIKNLENAPEAVKRFLDTAKKVFEPEDGKYVRGFVGLEVHDINKDLYFYTGLRFYTSTVPLYNFPLYRDHPGKYYVYALRDPIKDTKKIELLENNKYIRSLNEELSKLWDAKKKLRVKTGLIRGELITQDIQEYLTSKGVTHEVPIIIEVSGISSTPGYLLYDDNNLNEEHLDFLAATYFKSQRSHIANKRYEEIERLSNNNSKNEASLSNRPRVAIPIVISGKYYIKIPTNDGKTRHIVNEIQYDIKITYKQASLIASTKENNTEIPFIVVKKPSLKIGDEEIPLESRKTYIIINPHVFDSKRIRPTYEAFTLLLREHKFAKLDTKIISELPKGYGTHKLFE